MNILSLSRPEFLHHISTLSSEKQLEALQLRLSNNFLEYCQYIRPEFNFYRLHEVICNLAQDTVTTDNGRLLLSVPPGSGKSTLCSKLLVSWIFGRNPKSRVMLLSYGDDLSNDLGSEVRDIMQEEAYQFLFPMSKPRGTSKKGTFKTTEGGQLRAVGRGSGITGFRSDYTILDDTIKGAREARSKKILTTLWDWFTTEAYTRLVEGGKLIAFNTRWCHNDLIGKCKEKYDDWNYVNIEAICEDSDNDPLGRKEGEHIGDYYMTLQRLLEAREASPSTFGNLYQGKPINLAASPIKRSSILNSVGSLEKCEHTIVLSWDTASTVSKNSDYTVCTVWKVTKDKTELVKIYRDRFEMPDLIKHYDELNKLWKPVTNIVESASSGLQLLQLRNENSTASKVFKSDDKLNYAEVFNTMMDCKDVLINDDCTDPEYLTELESFTFGKHDDILLSILHFIKNWRDPKLKLWDISRSRKRSRSNMPRNYMRYFGDDDYSGGRM